MDPQLIHFGDVFRHNEKEYVFLAQSDVIYAAIILNEVMTQRISKLSDQREVQLSRQKNSPAFAIVILETDEFQGRGAHLGGTGNADHQTTSFDIISTCHENDVKHLRDEIVADGSVVPIKLMEIVKGLNIK